MTAVSQSQSTARRTYTPEEYFELERTSDVRHEYVGDGLVVAMAGGSIDHATIGLNVAGELRSRLAGRPCRAFNTDTRIKVRATGKFRYADASALCGDAQIETDSGEESLANPQLIVEVLSPSTARADRGSKFDDYSTIASLTEYVLLEQDEPRAMVLTRRPGGPWQVTSVAGLDATLALASVGIEIPMREIYRNVELPHPTSIVVEPVPTTPRSAPSPATAPTNPTDPAAAGIAGPGDHT